MPVTQTEILKRAEQLAGALTGGPIRVERNVLLAVVADFMSDRQPDLKKLRRTLEFLGEGSGGQLKRGGAYANQIRIVAAELGKFLDSESLQQADCKSIFGWTARLMLVRGLPAAPQGAGSSNAPALPDSRRRPKPALSSRPSQLGAIDQKSLSVLERLKQGLEEREKNGNQNDEK
jgi:hypothetical protein